MEPRIPALDRLIPHTPRAIDRPRLIKQLSAGPEHLILITAPPGFGKTTLAAQYARQSGLPVAWHTISERERDVSRLYDHSLEVLEAVIPGFREGLPPSGEIPPNELATLLTEKLRKVHPGPILYVLDDLHLLGGAAATETWLNALMQTRPDTCQLILVSRTVPSLTTYIEMVVRQQIQTVNQQLLRMRDNEALLLAHSIFDQDLPEDDVLDLVERLEGWPAGLALAFQPLSDGIGGHVIQSRGEDAERVFWTLANAIFQGQPPDLQHFLLVSSVPAILTPEICSAALSLPNASFQLGVLQSRNLFLTRVSGGLTYHGLFREYLQQRLQQQHPGQFADLHRSAARWFESRENLDAAFDHYLKAGEVEAASAIAERVAVAWFGEGRLETLMRWNDELEASNGHTPTLLCMCALIQLNHYEFEAAMQKLEKAERIFIQQVDQDGHDEVQILRATIAMLRGEHDNAIRLAEPLLKHPAASLRGRALRIIGATLMNRGELQACLPYFEEAIGLMEEAGLVSSLSHLLQDVQHTYTRLGQLEEAGEYLQRVVVLRRQLGGAGALAMALNNLGYYYHQLGSYASAATTFEEGLRLIAGVPDRRTKAYLLCSLGDLERDLGHYQRAETLYGQALEQVAREAEPGLRSFIMTSMATMRRWQKQPESAVMLAESALKLAQENQNRFEAVLAEVAWRLAQLETTGDLAMISQLDAALEKLCSVGARFEYMGACTAASLFHARHSSRPDQSDSCLWRAVTVADEMGTAQPIAAELHRRTLVDVSIPDGPGGHLVKQHLQSLQEAAVRQESSAANDQGAAEVYSLTVYTLGRDEIERDGKSIDPSKWRAAPARELFYYLLFNGAQSKETISLIFWPEYSSKQVRGLLHTTLYRARSAVGADTIIYEDGRYQLNDDLTIWCDVLEIERMAARATTIPPRNVRAEDLWQRVARLYQGDFLPAFDRDWIVVRRERLKDLYLTALAGLGKCAYWRSDLAEALDRYQQALTIDPYQEDVHLEVLRCYAEMGQTHEMQNHFIQASKMFQEDIGADLPDDLREFYHAHLT